MTSSRKIFQSLAARAAQTPFKSSAPRVPTFVTRRIDPITTPRYPPRSITPAFSSYLSCRFNSTTTRPPNPLTDSKPARPEEAAQNEQRRAEERAFQITFTCRPCQHRSSHRISQHGYYKGTVLITCPECKNRHIISDHLNIFMDTKATLEDILAVRGMKLKKGKLEGDMEWWDDGTVRAVDGSVSQSLESGSGQQEGQQQQQEEPQKDVEQTDEKDPKA
ncbi:hypothetical protein FQN55_007487 [Onygenales sp. PD_40]|nr:hypothetical protein FQN55_007487 [Onygenales sp. PD_40]